MTTAENISAVLEITEPNKATRALRLEELLQTFKIDYVRDTPTPRLSGGERRRCEVARAMAASPSFMLLDEPFAGIDPLSVRSIKETIRALGASNVGILMSDQNLHEALELIDRAYVIDCGKVIFHGTPREMLSDTEVRRCYLGDDVIELPPVQVVRTEASVPQPKKMPQGHPTQTLSATPALG
jgi:lipopolysaccharide export system ATP-binding protein